MALNAKAAALALHRLGLGPRAGSIAAIASDPRGALLAELARPGAGRVADANLLTAAQSSTVAFNYRQERQARAIAEQQAKERAESDMATNADAPATEGEAPMKAADEPNIPQQNFRNEVRARLDAALGAEIGFVERLVWFWSNHFCISGDAVGNMAGGYEREAIRPHVLGRFSEMLLAAESHPAMLFYLDNSSSIGPNSVAGLINKRGLNENLAREILELHTLGVRTVYQQDDVTSFAKVITGWTIIPAAVDPAHGSEFIFNPRLHEPGPKQVIGKIYPDTGVEQGRAVLADLARHPATAAHVATKLARHFVADEPPPGLVERLTRRFLDTDGDLRELAVALVDAPEMWERPLSKLKRPSEWLVAALRITGTAVPNVQRYLQAQGMMGEPLWRPPAPKGFADDEGAWVDGLAQRLDVASQLAERVPADLDASRIVDEALGPLASAETRRTIANAESRPQALALLLMAPEFQRR